MTRKNFCLFPFATFSLGNGGNPRICCNNNAWNRVDQNKPFNDLTFTIEEDFNNPLHKEVRQSFLEDKRHPSCKKCWDSEDQGATSYRQMFTNSFKFENSDLEHWINKTDPDGTIHDIEFINLELTFGNKCNLKCVMCSGSNSSLFAKEQYENKEIPLTIYNQYMSLDWFEDAEQFKKLYPFIKKVTRIQILGGEPLIIEHQLLLQTLIELGISKNISLSYNSNLTTLPREILDTWKNFKNVTVGVSVDAYGNLNEFIRSPMKWDKLERNIEALQEIEGNIQIEIHATFGSLNYLQFTDFLEWVKVLSNKYIKVTPVPFYNYIYMPKWFDPIHLPENIKQLGYDRYVQWESNNRTLASHERNQMLNGLYTSVLETPGDTELWAKCLERISFFERVRNKQFTGFN
jgi:MoaA/NifB/PqqE/SkfB family radical SAM enzyme